MISHALRIRRTRPIIFGVARSINDKEGNPLAYLMINMEESQIYGMYQPLTEGNRNTVYVWTRDGNIISSSNRKLNGFEFFHMKNLERLFGSAPYIFTNDAGGRISSLPTIMTRLPDSRSWRRYRCQC